MMTKSFLTITSCLFLLAACAPQAELVRTRDEMTSLQKDTKTLKVMVRELRRNQEEIEANAKGTVDAQKVSADFGARSDQLATDIQILQGKLEENNFHIAALAQKLDDKSIKIAELASRTEELEAKMKLSSGGTGIAPDNSKSAPGSIEPSEAYRQAKNDFDKGNFDLALAGFQNYITRFPDTFQAASAQYWIGECSFSKKEFTRAIEAFEKVIKSYPGSNKVSGAKLKIGLSYLNEKKTTEAREYLNKVIQEYPGTNEAEIAKDRLQKIE